MRPTEILKAEHAALEALLDNLADALKRGAGWNVAFQRASASASALYRRERVFLDRLALHEPQLAAQLMGQHAEAEELAARIGDSLAEGNEKDGLSLARRFHAIVQHNVIQEERDAFPLADRCFDMTEQKRLISDFGLS